MLKWKASMSAETPAMALCAARRRSVAALVNWAGLARQDGKLSQRQAMRTAADEPPGAGDAGLGPFEVALGRQNPTA